MNYIVYYISIYNYKDIIGNVSNNVLFPKDKSHPHTNIHRIYIYIYIYIYLFIYTNTINYIHNNHITKILPKINYII